jgi:hypothetical protein
MEKGGPQVWVSKGRALGAKFSGAPFLVLDVPIFDATAAVRKETFVGS